jgi:hypothetical protein
VAYRNNKLLKLAKEAPHCFHCGTENFGQVVACHSNSLAMGKGISLKAADLPAFLCNRCHDLQDGRTPGWTIEEKLNNWAWAALKSIRWALEDHPEVFR